MTGGLRLHREYYIFIHTFVYSFALSPNPHSVGLCYIMPSNHVFCTQKQSSAETSHETAAKATFFFFFSVTETNSLNFQDTFVVMLLRVNGKKKKKKK